MNPSKHKAPLPPEVRQRLAEWGRIGGKRRAQTTTYQERRRIGQLGHKAQMENLQKKGQA